MSLIQEICLAQIENIHLTHDPSTRYDLYFTDKRIAIIYIGKKPEQVHYVGPGLVGALIVGTVLKPYIQREQKKTNDKLNQTAEQVNRITLDEAIKQNNKSAYYWYEELEEIQLERPSRFSQPKLIILSKDSMSELTLSKQQYEVVFQVLQTNEKTKNLIKAI